MTKRKTPAVARDRRVAIPLSPAEFQLIDYAASRSNSRGTLAWMRTKLLEAAKEKLNDATVADILAGRATMTLMRESLVEAKRTRRTPARTALTLVRGEGTPRTAEPARPGKTRGSKSRR